MFLLSPYFTIMTFSCQFKTATENPTHTHGKNTKERGNVHNMHSRIRLIMFLLSLYSPIMTCFWHFKTRQELGQHIT